MENNSIQVSEMEE